ncbi:tRNA-binding protein [Methylophaga sp.]|uniref:tRNA-binding protein n=1 Tax=Methylophaga sp. TaxID=2024840 RepID=UPI0013FF8593|nr:tRNA-binding protein [Methylophaga sp.]MTI62770.1 tRNA-binding protein [Methylophaga sp.]
MADLSWETFRQVELRVGTIIDARPFPESRNPSYILQVDFGPDIGVRKSSAQITDLYTPDTLLGRQVIAVTNFPPKQIGPIMSECLVTGFHRPDHSVVLATTDMPVPDGTRLA